MKSSAAAGVAGLFVAVLLFGHALPSSAQVTAQSASESAPPVSTRSGGILLTDLVTAVAKKTSKKFILEPRVQAQVFLTQDPSRISWDDFLNVLMVHGFVAVERGDTVLVMPDAIVKSSINSATF